MKTSFLTDSRSSTLVAIWLAFHLLLAVATLIRGSLSINTDLLDILPPSHAMQSVAAADRLATERNAQNVVILASHQDFSVAREAIEELYSAFRKDPAFESLALYFDDSVVGQISDYLFTHRHSLLDEKSIGVLEGGGAMELSQRALSTIYSPLTLTGLRYLDQDPFMLTESRLQGFLSSSLAGSTAMSPREGILSAQREGKWYTMLQGSLTKESTAITERGGIIPALKTQARQLEEDNPGLDFIFSGVPFHSFESSSSAQREISVITTVSLLVVMVLLLLVFRSVVPVVVSMASIGLSAAMAVSAVLLFLGEMNIMSLVFGTTLIGLGMDYSIHFFMARRRDRAQNGREALKSIFKGISFGFLSTQVCFVLLFLAPFPILKQIAVFLSFGLASTYLSVVCLYHLLPPLPPEAATPRVLQWLESSAPWRMLGSVKLRRGILGGLFFLPLLLLGIRWHDVKIENNLSQLYTMSEELSFDEMTSAQLLDHGSSGWYYIVSGDSQDQLLQHEEELRQQLDEEVGQGHLSSYLATSLFVPSYSTQKRSHQAAQHLAAAAPQHLAALGFSQEETQDFIARLRIPPQPIDVEQDLPPYLHSALQNLWLGALDGRWYSVVMPLHTTEEAPFRAIADSNPNVFFANLTKDVGTELDSLTKIMLILMAVAMVAILLLLKLWYRLEEILRIGCIPLCIFLVTTATLTLLGIPLGFFSVAALLLVFGTGIDYIIYTLESERENRESSVSLAIFLSYATTAMSFGALALTSFRPVHLFGLTILTGLSAGYICSVLLRRQPSSS